MTRSDLVERMVRDNPKLRIDDVERLVRTVFDAIGDHLEAGGRVEIRGFGTFSLRNRGPRTGRNPRNGKTVEVTAKRVAYFRPGKEMFERINPTS